MELGQLCELSVHVLVLHYFLERDVSLAQEDALPHDAPVLNADLQIRPVQPLVGALDKATKKDRETLDEFLVLIY